MEIPSFNCPYCGQANSPDLEEGSGVLTWTQDCENCCRPIALRAKIRQGRVMEFEALRELD